MISLARLNKSLETGIAVGLTLDNEEAYRE